MGTTRHSRGSGSREPNPPSGNSSPAPRELVVITSSDAGVRATHRGLESDRGADLTAIAEVLETPGVTLRPLFDLPEQRIRARVAEVAAADADLPDLSTFYQVEAPEDQLDEIAERLRNAPGIEGAYVKPQAELPQLNEMLPSPEDAPPATPDFTPKQGYLNVSPGGIDAKFAWTKPGGTGTGINIIDIEGAWRFTHEDLGINQGGMVGGVASSNISWRNHGTAVIGQFSGDKNTFGITGICPDAKVRAVSIFQANGGASSSNALVTAANLLSKGDIILIELHRPGPRFNFGAPQGQKGFIAIEWWPDDLAAIKFAVAKGIIVVEAAGNGFENLDDPIYNVRPTGFPTSWVNPFKRNPVDSGAIVVGAGAPPSGSFGADRSRLDFSNFGALIDAQGWGREVVTAGYGDLQGGLNENFWYTKSFSGTSSASPIVVGAVGCLQGMVKAASKPPLTPAQVRKHLRDTGSPQQNGPSGTTAQRIGNRPNLKQLHGKVFGTKSVKEFIKDKDFKDIEKIKDVKEIEATPPPASGATEQRLAALEQAVVKLAHFITSELRPDLSESALAAESDDAAAESLSERLQKQASDAKSIKDDKDVEKTRDA